MARHAVSLNIVINASNEVMGDEVQLRELCMKKMHQILGTGFNPPYATKAWEDLVTIEKFDEIDDEDEDEDIKRYIVTATVKSGDNWVEDSDIFKGKTPEEAQEEAGKFFTSIYGENWRIESAVEE